MEARRSLVTRRLVAVDLVQLARRHRTLAAARDAVHRYTILGQELVQIHVLLEIEK